MTRHVVALVQAISWDLSGAACKHLTRWWATCERALETIEDPVHHTAILTEAAAYCTECPVTVSCVERARIDHYTGIAAGAEYRNGNRRPPPSQSCGEEP